MLPLLIPAIIAGIAAAAGGVAQGVAGHSAAKKQSSAADRAMDLMRGSWKEQQGYQQPWLNAGQSSLADLMRLQSDPSAINGSPAYQFRLSEGQRALERSAAARGGLAGGGFAKALTRYGQGLASEEYGNQWNRLYQAAGMGQRSAENLAAGDQHFADSMAGLYGAQGNARAAGDIAIGNATGGAIRSIGNIATMGAGGGLGSLAGGMGDAYGSIPTQNRINPLGRY